jgi:hypothetical protein
MLQVVVSCINLQDLRSILISFFELRSIRSYDQPILDDDLMHVFKRAWHFFLEVESSDQRYLLGCFYKGTNRTKRKRPWGSKTKYWSRLVFLYLVLFFSGLFGGLNCNPFK